MGIQVPPDSTGKVVETNSPDGSTQRQVVTVGDKTTAARTLTISAGGAALVDASATVQPVSGPLTDTQLRASAVPISVATIPSHAVTNAGTFAVQATEADGANTTLGAKGDAKSTATDTTAVSVVSVLKQISASVQAPPSQAVTNAGTFAVQAGNLPTTVDTNSGVKSASTLRVVLATDQPALTNKLLVTPDSVALPANQSVNNSQINGVTPLMGNGVTGTGSQRVTIASDNTPFTVNSQSVPTTTGGCSFFSAANSGTKAAVKASAGQIYGWQILNTTAAIAYVQLFNVASASVTVGTTAPDLVLGLPASGGATFSSDVGIAFGTAITVACTTTRAGSTGAACEVAFFYK